MKKNNISFLRVGIEPTTPRAYSRLRPSGCAMTSVYRIYFLNIKHFGQYNTKEPFRIGIASITCIAEGNILCSISIRLQKLISFGKFYEK